MQDCEVACSSVSHIQAKARIKAGHQVSYTRPGSVGRGPRTVPVTQAISWMCCIIKTNFTRGAPASPGVRTLRFHCCGPGCNPWSGSRIP